MTSIEIDFSTCSRNANTCPVVAQCLEYDEFAAVTQSLDPTAAKTRRMIGNLMTSCTKGTCIGKNYEEAESLLRSIIEQKRSKD